MSSSYKRLCCCVPCQLSAINSLCLWILHRRFRTHSVSDYNNSLSGSHIHVCKCVYAKCVYVTGGNPFVEDIRLVELMYLVFTRAPGGVTVGGSGLCCCVPCLLSTINSLCLLILSKNELKFWVFSSKSN